MLYLELRHKLAVRYANVLGGVFREPAALEAERALLELAGDWEVAALVPDVREYAGACLAARAAGNTEAREIALIELYARLHGAGHAYSASEKLVLGSRSGIPCHPGGLMPLILAEPLIGPDTVTADLGAGNGLQGLLLQRIRPHSRTVQVEISSGMVRTGRMFQRALGIEEGRVEWVCDDISNASLGACDLIYLYRPAKPMRGGHELYQSIAEKLREARKPLVVLSVADCLGRFLDGGFRVLYENEHLKCFVKG